MPYWLYLKLGAVAGLCLISAGLAYYVQQLRMDVITLKAGDEKREAVEAQKASDKAECDAKQKKSNEIASQYQDRADALERSRAAFSRVQPNKCVSVIIREPASMASTSGSDALLPGSVRAESIINAGHAGMLCAEKVATAISETTAQ